MKDKYFLGIDLGTTGCKSMVFDSAGCPLGEAYIEYDLIFTPEGYVEQDADLWWDNTSCAIKKAISMAGIPGEQIEALSISSQGIAIVMVDAKGHTLGNALSWYDNRGNCYAEAFKERYGNEYLFRTTGRHAGAMLITQAMWMKQHRPEIYEKTAHILMPMDFIQYRLTGRCMTDYSMASGTLCYDIGNKCWLKDMLDEQGIDIGKLPETGCMGSIVGTVLPEVAAQLGLSENTKVVLGGQDQKICAYGAGITEGVLTLSIGTASALCSLIHPENYFGAVAKHGYNESYNILEGVVGTSGAAQKWFKNMILPEGSYRTLDEMAALSVPGANGVIFVPYLSPKLAGRSAGAFIGLKLDTTRNDLIRAVQEGIAFDIRRLIEIQKECNPLISKAGEIRTFGGGANSDIWLQIIADVTGMRVSVPRVREAGNLGAAALAAEAVGAGEAFGAYCSRQGRSFEPREEYHIMYEEYYRSFLECIRTE